MVLMLRVFSGRRIALPESHGTTTLLLKTKNFYRYFGKYLLASKVRYSFQDVIHDPRD